VPPVPLGNGLAFPEFAAALKARLQAEAAERAAVTGRRRALPAHDEDEQAHDGVLGDEDDGKPWPFCLPCYLLVAWLAGLHVTLDKFSVLFWLMLNKVSKMRCHDVPQTVTATATTAAMSRRTTATTSFPCLPARQRVRRP